MRLLLLLLALTGIGFAGSARAQQGCGPVEVVNRHAEAIIELYIRPTGQEAWGRDQLGEAIIDPGATARLPPPAAEQHDLLVLRRGGGAVMLWRQPLCGARRVTLGADGRLRPE